MAYVVTTPLGPERGNQKNQNVRPSNLHTHFFVHASKYKTPVQVPYHTQVTKIWPFTFVQLSRINLTFSIQSWMKAGAQKLDKNGGEKNQRTEAMVKILKWNHLA